MVAINQLPNETFSLIISFQELADRLTCIRVCQKWYQIITSNILYQELKFEENEPPFYKAIELFDTKEQYGRPVNRLEINNTDIDVHSVFLLPRQFPNLKELVWIITTEVFEEPKKKVIFHLPPKQVYEREFRKWKHLRSMTTEIECLPLATYFLGSGTSDNLTRVDVSLRRLLDMDGYDFAAPTLKALRPVTKVLIKNLKNAHYLEHFALRYCALDLDDMENLHDGTPHLQHLELERACIYTADTNKNITVDSGGKLMINNKEPGIIVSPASSIRTLSLDFTVISRTFTPTPSIHTMEILKGPITKWITYISHKYTGTNKLSLSVSDMGKTPVIPTLEGRVIDVINSMPNLTSYGVDLHPITKSIMKAIDEKNIKLEEIRVRMSGPEEIKDQLKNIQSSGQTKTIKSLNIKARLVRLDERMFIPSFLALARELPHLVDLCIRSITKQAVFVKILQNLPNLKKFKIDSFDIADEYEDALDTRRIKPTKIKQLYVGAYSEEVENIEQINNVLKFTAQSCPHLEDFTFSGEFSCEAPDAIQIHLLNQNHLKSITVDVENSDHYSFSKIPSKRGKRWADYKTPVGRDADEVLFHIDLTWKGNVKLNLTKAKPYSIGGR